MFRTIASLAILVHVIVAPAPTFAQVPELPSLFAVHDLNLIPSRSYQEATLGDVDGDERVEVVLVVRDNRIHVAEILPGGVAVDEFDITLPPQTSQHSWHSPYVADMDGDGDADIVAWSRRNNARGLLAVAVQGPPGVFDVRAFPTPEEDAGYKMAVADVDGDGYPDILTTNAGFAAQGALFVMFNDNLSFSSFSSYPTGSDAVKVFTADLDGDGRMDAVVPTHDSGGSARAHVFFQGVASSPGNFVTPPLQLPILADGRRSSSIETADMNGDGYLDIITNATKAHEDAAPYLYIHFLQPSTSGPTPTYSAPFQLGTSVGAPKEPRVADFNNDGHPDLVVSLTRIRELEFFPGRSDTGFFDLIPQRLADPLVASVDHGVGSNPNHMIVGDVDNDGDIDILIVERSQIFLENSVGARNRAPVAMCASCTAETTFGTCAATCSIDSGSSDPDGDAFTLSQLPGGPYATGETSVTLTIEDVAGEADSCRATVAVVDAEGPSVSCNSQTMIVPPDTPISWTATASDNCGVFAVTVQDLDCYMVTKKGKRIDTTDSCGVELSGATVTILESGGVGGHISWVATATDLSGNAESIECEVEVVNPGKN